MPKEEQGFPSNNGSKVHLLRNKTARFSKTSLFAQLCKLAVGLYLFLETCFSQTNTRIFQTYIYIYIYVFVFRVSIEQSELSLAADCPCNYLWLQDWCQGFKPTCAM